MHVAYLPDLLFANERFQRGAALNVRDGRITSVGAPEAGATVERLANRALLPGLVNAHSHAFQRAIRGRTEWREAGHETDDFWTWREQMYRAAMQLTPDEVFSVSRMCFLEMALSGITTVGEFHYLHRDPQGATYADVNELAHRVIAAAREVGLRIALLRVGYGRAGFGKAANPRQVRFIDPSSDDVLKATEALRTRYADHATWVGVAPHSVRAVRREWLEEMGAYSAKHAMPFHLHLSEQPREVKECEAEHQCRPAELMHRLQLLGPRLTAVHAVHLTAQEKTLLGMSKSTVCACPTTERNLGDGVVDPSFTSVALGSDSQVQIAPLEDARQLEYHLRLQRLERAILAPRDRAGDTSALARRLFGCASANGARSLGAGPGVFEPGSSADAFSVALDDPSLLGSTDTDLLSTLVFSMERTAIRDVVVQGNAIVRDGRHPKQELIGREYVAATRRLWEAA